MRRRPARGSPSSCSARNQRRPYGALRRTPVRRGHRRGGTPPGARPERRGFDRDRSRRRQPARPAARSALICAMNARTLSGVSRRRPSRVMGTSSSVGTRSPPARSLPQRPTTSSVTTPAYARSRVRVAATGAARDGCVRRRGAGQLRRSPVRVDAKTAEPLRDLVRIEADELAHLLVRDPALVNLGADEVLAHVEHLGEFRDAEPLRWRLAAGTRVAPCHGVVLGRDGRHPRPPSYVQGTSRRHAVTDLTSSGASIPIRGPSVASPLRWDREDAESVTRTPRRRLSVLQLTSRRVLVCARSRDHGGEHDGDEREGHGGADRRVVGQPERGCGPGLPGSLPMGRRAVSSSARRCPGRRRCAAASLHWFDPGDDRRR